MVEIRCQYFGERIAFRLPSFYINNKTIKVENANTIQTELADYEHKHSLAQEKGRWTASYTLTLKGARTSDNNSVYQCFCELGEGSLVWSKPVTLTVIGKQNADRQFVRTCMHACLHAHTHTRTHAHTHTRTHAHTHSLSLNPYWISCKL